MIRVRVVDDSPGGTLELTARTSTALGFGDPKRPGEKVATPRYWIEGARMVAAPSKSTPVAQTWKTDPVGDLAIQFDLRGVERVQRTGTDAYVEVYDTEPHALLFCGADGPQHAWDLGAGGRWEVVRHGVAIVLDFATKQLVVLRGAAATAIELPPQIDTGIHGGRIHDRLLHYIDKQDCLVIVGKQRASLFYVEDLLALTDRAAWTFAWIFPYGDPAASAHGVVTMSKWGRANIQLGERKIAIGATPLTEGEHVTLRGLLWDRLSSTVYREIVRADGSVLPYPGAPDTSDATTAVTPR